MATPTIFVQLFQLYYHSRLLPAFATALGTEKNDKVKEQVASAILFFLKNTLPDSFSFRAGRDELIMKLLVSVQGDVTPKHKSILLSAFNIVAEKCATVALEFQSSYLPILLEACNDENYEVKEEAARGIRICAESESQEVKRLMKEILSKLYFLLKHPNQPLRSLENAKARDIAVSALGRICKCHRDCIDASNLVPIWLSFLPLKEELNEAKIMHEQLCLMVYGSDMDLLGPENQNLAKIIVVFVEVIEKGKTLATPETVKTMTHLLGDLMLLSMNSQQQQLLSSLVSS
ncbi:hypothetical protein QN277_015958 [Acacia crassicarpa]|uniref:Uncharacterized protein n=1 Tax=Acacia crassicarpa TaxID=499986 RepID=A0AAE1KL10_9FABA|nr:hypothetical protein QN277_015958 [Acacia crassicarpa]